jgi:hypothetical protein
MPDMSFAAGLLSSFSAAQNIAKALLELRTISEVQGKVVELQSVIMAAQSSALAGQAEQSALIQRVADLEKELAAVKAWEAEKQRYELKALEPGVFAYALKREASGSEPPHWICSRCYHEGTKSLLQNEGDQWGSTKYLCHSCKSSISVKSSNQPSF